MVALDQNKMRDLLSAASLDLLSCSGMSSEDVPEDQTASLYAYASISQDQDAAITQPIGPKRTAVSNHDKLRRTEVLQRAARHIAQIRDMVVEQAPVLDHTTAFWDIEFFTRYSPEIKPGMPSQSISSRLAGIEMEVSISGLKIIPTQAQGATEAIDIEHTILEISRICDRLSVIPAPGDRIFNIEDAYIGASSPEEALLVYDTITNARLMENIHQEASRKKKTYQTQISEIFSLDQVCADMRRRFKA
jgi:hypothetical protein